MRVTPEQKKAAEFYAKATPKQARKRALRKYIVPLNKAVCRHPLCACRAGKCEKLY